MRLIVLLGAISAILAACSSTVEPLDGPLHLTVHVERPTIQLGDSTAVTITLRNISPRPVTFTTGGCVLLPYITAQTSGEIVYPSNGSWVCTLNPVRKTLASGDTESQRLTVRGADAPAPFGAAALGRGHYLVYATLQSSQYPLRAVSTPLTIE